MSDSSDISKEGSHNSADNKSQARRGFGNLLACLLLALVAGGLYVVRTSVAESDHAVANVFTVLLVLVGWLVAVLWCFIAGGSRALGTVLLIAPFAALGGTLALFRLKGLDSELIPQWESRWSEPPAPPTVAAGVSEDSGQLFEASDFDFPQFLGRSRDGVLGLAIDSDWESGAPEIMWRQPIGKGWSGFAVQGDLAVTMEQRDNEEWVAAYNIQDGSLIWKYEIDSKHSTVPGGTGPRSTPTIANNRVFACSAVDRFVCLDIREGTEIWALDLLELAQVDQAAFEADVSWGRSGSPLVYDETVCIPLGGETGNCQTLLALEASTGIEKWRSGKDQITYSSPILALVSGVPQIVLVAEDFVSAYDPESGQILWACEWEGKANANPAVAQPVVTGANTFLLGKGYGGGSKHIRVQQDDTGDWQVEELWSKSSLMKTKFTTAVVLDGFAYGLSDGILECVDIQAGKRVWKRGRYKHGQLLLLGDKLLIASERGDLVLVAASPAGFQELAKMAVLSGVTWNTLALSGNRLLIRNSDELACVRLPVSDAAAAVEAAPKNAG